MAISRTYAEKLVAECLSQQRRLRDLANDAREALQPDDAALVIQRIGSVLGAIELDLLSYFFDEFPDLEPRDDAL